MADASVDAEAHPGDHAEHRSRWPIISAVGAAGLYAGLAVVFLAESLEFLPAIPGVVMAVGGAGALVVGLAGWVNEAFIAEYRAAGEATARTEYRTTMILFLVTDVATFAAGFVYYVFIRAGTWPPAHLPTLLGSLVAVNTAVLVASSITLHYAHVALHEGSRQRFRRLLGVTLVLGVVFLFGQALEYYEFIVGEGFTIADGVFASAFYGLTGLHGLHVSLGVVLLAVVFARTLRGHYGPERDTSITTVSLYWHFVDAVWLVLVAVVYVGAAV